VVVDVHAAHLANPVVAVQRILASEAELIARVTGDDTRIEIVAALPFETPESRELAEAWIRWALHVAGVRGDAHVVEG
jgi:hypothetical protein